MLGNRYVQNNIMNCLSTSVDQETDPKIVVVKVGKRLVPPMTVPPKCLWCDSC
jgi:hypothetical protein